MTAEAIARDGAACVAAGAAELHLHPRGPDGRESLAAPAMDATISALRHACPGTFVGVSTGEWIERDEFRTLASIDGWDELPDYASVNLGERAAPAVMEKLRQRAIGVEAGLAAIAEMVHDIDLKDRRYQRPETAGLARLIDGLCSESQVDELRLQRGSVIFESLHKSFA